jgi:hypothetical protein
MDFDSLLDGADDRRSAVMSRRMPPQTARARDSVRFNDDLRNSLAHDLIIENSTSLVKLSLEKGGKDVDYSKIIELVTNKFMIGQKQFDFDPHEQIYFLREAIKT